jgi:hypothetical protein
VLLFAASLGAGGTFAVRHLTADKNDTAAGVSAVPSSAQESRPSPFASVQPVPAGRPGTPAGDPLPRLDQVDGRDPAAVVRGALTVMWRYDTALDTTTNDAVLRATPWLTTPYAAAQREHAPLAAPGAQWLEWTAHQAYTAVTVTPVSDAAPENTSTVDHSQWLVTAVPVGRDGWRGMTQISTVFVLAARSGPADPWRVSGVHVADQREQGNS